MPFHIGSRPAIPGLHPSMIREPCRRLRPHPTGLQARGPDREDNESCVPPGRNAPRAHALKRQVTTTNHVARARDRSRHGGAPVSTDEYAVCAGGAFDGDHANRDTALSACRWRRGWRGGRCTGGGRRPCRHHHRLGGRLLVRVRRLCRRAGWPEERHGGSDRYLLPGGRVGAGSLHDRGGWPPVRADGSGGRGRDLCGRPG